MARELIDREEEEKSEKRAGGEHHSGPAKPVAEIAPKRPGLRGSWSVRHRGNYLQAARKVTPKIDVDPAIRIDLQICGFRPAANGAEGSRYFFKERT
jgi:hypothetical protein